MKENRWNETFSISYSFASIDFCLNIYESIKLIKSIKDLNEFNNLSLVTHFSLFQSFSSRFYLRLVNSVYSCVVECCMISLPEMEN